VQNDTLKRTQVIDTSQMSLTGVNKEQESDRNDMDEYLAGLEE